MNIDATMLKELEVAIWPHIKVNRECWLWTKPAKDGVEWSLKYHPKVSINRQQVDVRRAVWFMVKGENPTSARLEDLCATTGCINPAHMYEPTYEHDFWRHIAKQKEGCWLWLGKPGRSGYGFLRNKKYKNRHAHRIAWELTNGQVPEGLCVLHECDVKLCCRPDHLYLGTHRQNTDDALAHGLFPVGEKCAVSVLTEEQVIRMRQMRVDGFIYKDIAKECGTTAGNVFCVCKRKTWRHLP